VNENLESPLAAVVVPKETGAGRTSTDPAVWAPHAGLAP